VFINLGPIAAFPGRELYAHDAARKVFVGETLRLTNADGVDLAVHMRRYEVRLWGFVAMAEMEAVGA
jgi:hypothetical protein